ncbi:MAG: sigma-70 family RNA polymerase sigma factor [Hyphomicrobiales bacterium]|nr:sigma-70 family RNA polymerase sigma factor [Hyphomicrobiales bacterium]
MSSTLFSFREIARTPGIARFPGAGLRGAGSGLRCANGAHRNVGVKPLQAEDHVRAVARGDRIAFRALYDAASPRLFAVILRLVRNRAAAEDVLQDVFLRIWRSAPQFDVSRGSAQAWMVTIARNRAIDHIRQNHAATTRPDDEDELAQVADPHDAEASLSDRDGLRHCLQLIEADKRACLLAAYYEGASREELALHYGQPVNTIKTWLHRALATLRQCLEGKS